MQGSCGRCTRRLADEDRARVLGLQLAVSRVEKMGIKTIYCGKQKRRYLWGQVLDQLAERAQ